MHEMRQNIALSALVKENIGFFLHMLIQYEVNAEKKLS